MTRFCREIACLLISAMATTAALTQLNSAGRPPFYQRLTSRATVQSMVYGPTDLSGRPLRSAEPARSSPAPTPQCAIQPDAKALHTYQGLQPATVSEARGLGVTLRGTNGDAVPFLNGRIVLWRAGRYGRCESLGGSGHLVFGSDLVVAFLLGPEGSPVPLKMTELEASIAAGKVLAVGATLNGPTAAPELQAALDHLSAEGGAVLSQRFAELRRRWDREQSHVVSLQPIGIIPASAE